MDQYFDLTYAGLAAGILLALGYALVTALGVRGRSAAPGLRQEAEAVSWMAFGTAIALVGGLVADAVLKSSAFFQQARFASYYAGFALVTAGMASIMGATPGGTTRPSSRGRLARLILWLAFASALVVSAYFLLDPATFQFNPGGLQVQRVVYWIPMLTTTLVGAVALFLLTSSVGERGQRGARWAGAFAALVFAGLLRESLILPDLGDPLTNLLAAFIPFFLGSLCLCVAARRLATNAKGDSAADESQRLEFRR